MLFELQYQNIIEKIELIAQRRKLDYEKIHLLSGAVAKIELSNGELITINDFDLINI